MNARGKLEEELKEALAEKAKATLDEDYEKAGMLKTKIAMLKEQTASIDSNGGLGNLQQALNNALVEKEKATENEDYEKAGQFKMTVAKLKEQIASINSNGGLNGGLGKLQQALTEALAEKAKATEDEDYEKAGELKTKIAMLKEQMSRAGAQVDSNGGLGKLQEALKEALELKAKAIVDEDYEKAGKLQMQVSKIKEQISCANC